MAVYGLTHGWFGNDDGPLRPSDETWRQINRMHNHINPDQERSIFESAFRDDAPYGMNQAEQWRYQNKPSKPQPRDTEAEIFSYGVMFMDEK